MCVADWPILIRRQFAPNAAASSLEAQRPFSVRGSQSVRQSKMPSPTPGPLWSHVAANSALVVRAGGAGRAKSASGWQGLVVQKSQGLTSRPPLAKICHRPNASAPRASSAAAAAIHRLRTNTAFRTAVQTVLASAG